MTLGEGVADLHLHTLASDGTCTVDDRLDQATERNLEAIAITDHDVVADEVTGRVRDCDGLELVTGVEVRADVEGTKVELLGLYVDPTDDRLRAVLERVRGYRRERNEAIVEKLNEVTALDCSIEAIRATADGILGRPHLAAILVNEDIVDSIGAAFDRYLGADGEAFVPMNRVPAAEVVDALRGAGGVVSLAHPGRIRTADVRPLVSHLVDCGLDAIEVPYPYDSAPSEGYADVGASDAAALATEFELAWSGGSDCHGPDSGKYRIGSVRLERARFEELRTLADERRML